MNIYHYSAENIKTTTVTGMSGKNGQKKQEGFDNRANFVAQQKTIAGMQGASQVLQAYKTIPECISFELRYIGRDLFHSDFYNLFKDSTSDFVATSRDNGKINYRKMRDTYSLENKQSLEKWLDKDDGHHIYVYQGQSLTGGIDPGGSDHWPHPTLLGGDPEVDFAGEFVFKRWLSGKEAYEVNADSGHFRPNKSDAKRQEIIKRYNEILGPTSSYVLVEE